LQKESSPARANGEQQARVPKRERWFWEEAAGPQGRGAGKAPGPAARVEPGVRSKKQRPIFTAPDASGLAPDRSGPVSGSGAPPGGCPRAPCASLCAAGRPDTRQPPPGWKAAPQAGDGNLRISRSRPVPRVNHGPDPGRNRPPPPQSVGTATASGANGSHVESGPQAQHLVPPPPRPHHLVLYPPPPTDNRCQFQQSPCQHTP